MGGGGVKYTIRNWYYLTLTMKLGIIAKVAAKPKKKVHQNEGIQHVADGSTESRPGLRKSACGGVVPP